MKQTNQILKDYFIYLSLIFQYKVLFRDFVEDALS
jgi:hypothetical protein